MEFIRYGAAGSEQPAVRDDAGTTYDLRGLTADIDGAFLAADGIARTRAALAAGELPALALADDVRIGAPIARPQAVSCIGMNYAAHAAESGAEPPAVPVLFYKHPGTVVGPDDDVLLPVGSTRSDWEVELGVVIKDTPRHLSDDADPLAYVAGYVTANDLSERASQLEHSGGQWSKGKSAETFCPVGPVLRPADEIDPQALRLRSWVNDEPRQDSSTADMVFTVAEIVRHLSRHVYLAPGDLVLTGTPEGVALSGRFPYLADGDVMDLEIEGLGHQRQRVRQAVSAVSAAP
ncbi:fumarylacetoacetate hydrolase family protein [Nocardioides nitrophenolicus]|uniref:fumarylacetoacetate hydrolase family protein n=1 Tax=Nocardioides nitrophenolicus TaxID=60489 RepID=UPI00195AECFC|nr:fumarylacetoacetate hydrolase family protein [Nocardioides nitrophenolicus]MBM7517380.1 2-keto-4-pentenoate hydratase/2-oxohepta-3-ene-1,7-dioic acid hydratase in catechol pathway [Nocardioides nitrophenolicus]